MKLNDYCDKAMAQLEYVSTIESLMYVMHCIRLDITFIICKLSRYTSKSNTYHWKAIARVFNYLKRTINLSLFYSNFPAVMEGYSDASWMTSSGDNKSISGWIFSLEGGAIS